MDAFCIDGAIEQKLIGASIAEAYMEVSTLTVDMMEKDNSLWRHMQVLVKDDLDWLKL